MSDAMPLIAFGLRSEIPSLQFESPLSVDGKSNAQMAVEIGEALSSLLNNAQRTGQIRFGGKVRLRAHVEVIEDSEYGFEGQA